MAGTQIEPAIRLGEWLTILAALIGPILAVQAQKLVELGRNKRTMRDGIFRTLMATRGSRLAPDHVQALNMIDLAFYGTRLFGRRLQSSAERSVCRARRTYFDCLEPLPANATEAQHAQSAHSREEKFYDLLEEIAKAQNFDFDRVELQRAHYTPVAHGSIESDQEAIRIGLAKLLRGDVALPMRVVNFPAPE
jgi:hypothetical protein